MRRQDPHIKGPWAHGPWVPPPHPQVRLVPRAQEGAGRAGRRPGRGQAWGFGPGRDGPGKGQAGQGPGRELDANHVKAFTNTLRESVKAKMLLEINAIALKRRHSTMR